MAGQTSNLGWRFITWWLSQIPVRGLHYRYFRWILATIAYNSSQFKWLKQPGCRQGHACDRAAEPDFWQFEPVAHSDLGIACPWDTEERKRLRHFNSRIEFRTSWNLSGRKLGTHTRSLEVTYLTMTFDLSEVIGRYASVMLARNCYYWLET